MGRSALCLLLIALVGGGCKSSICARRSDCAAPLTCTAVGVCGVEAIDAAAPDGDGGLDAAAAADAAVHVDAAAVGDAQVDAPATFFDAPATDMPDGGF